MEAAQQHTLCWQQKRPILAGASTGKACCSHGASQSPPTPRSPLPTRVAGAPAFTLLEVILAVTIAGALLAAAAALMVSVSTVWMDRQDRHFFEDHVDGVTEFLQASFSNAGSAIARDAASDETTPENPENSQPPTTEDNPDGVTVGINTPNARSGNGNDESENTSGSLIRVAEEPVGWANPPGLAEYQDPLIHFALKEAPPLLVQTGAAPIVGIEAYLHFDADEGLSLLCYSPLQEQSEDINDLRRTPISDLVTKVEYVYWDERFEKWETEDAPREDDATDEFLLPRFLKLTFEYEGETKTRTLTIPVPSQSVLLF